MISSPSVDIAALPRAVPPPRTEETSKSTVAMTPRPAAELFREGNELRLSNRRAEAKEVYAELQRRYPASDQAAVSRVTLGRLYAQDGDATKALAQFDAYLTHGTRGASLREDAMTGRALALQKLGRTEEERAAWSALLREFPEAAVVTTAKERLQKLE